MQPISKKTQERLHQAQLLLQQKDKAMPLNHTKLEVYHDSDLLVRFMAKNTVKMIEVIQIVRKKLALKKQSGLQFFFNGQVLANGVTVEQLRSKLNGQSVIRISAQSMEAFG